MAAGHRRLADRGAHFRLVPGRALREQRGRRAYVAAGLRALPLGDEAIIEVAEFTLNGPTMEPIRRAVRRIERAGYRISVARHADLPAETLAEMQQRAEDWRGEAPERGFSMALGRLGDPADGQCVAVLADDADGRLRGLLSMVPWGQRGLSLDLMRRDRESENGVIEAMVAELVRAARDDLRVAADLAELRDVPRDLRCRGAGRSRPDGPARLPALTFASRFWQIESLYRSNARYLPRWEPRYLCYDSALTLARVSLAAGRAEGFLPALVRPPERGRATRSIWGGRTMPLAEAVALQRAAAGRLTAPDRGGSKEQQRVRLAKLDHLRAAGWTRIRSASRATRPSPSVVAELPGTGRRGAHRADGVGRRAGAGDPGLRRRRLPRPRDGRASTAGAGRAVLRRPRGARAAARRRRPRRPRQRHRGGRRLRQGRAIDPRRLLAAGGQVPAARCRTSGAA